MQGMEEFSKAQYKIRLYSGQGDNLPCVYTLLYEDRCNDLYHEIAKIPCHTHHLVCIYGLSWFTDMTPWKADISSKMADWFKPGAEAFLKVLTDEIIPETEKRISDPPSLRVLCGYSLAGMFSLWTATRTTLFSRVGSFSGSLWYPGFTGYLEKTPFTGQIDRVYISVGDREKLSKDPQMALTESAARDCADLISSRGIPVRFELNSGDHNHAENWRSAKGIRALVNKRF